jgi:hypothetical protein
MSRFLPCGEMFGRDTLFIARSLREEVLDAKQV